MPELELLKTKVEKKPLLKFGVRYYAEDAGKGFNGSMVCPCGSEEYSIKFKAEGEGQGLYAECLGCKNLFMLADRPIKDEKSGGE